MLITIGLIVGALVLLYVYLTWTFNHWKDLGVPGPKPTALLGNLPSAITQKQNVAYEIDEIYRYGHVLCKYLLLFCIEIVHKNIYIYLISQ